MDMRDVDIRGLISNQPVRLAGYWCSFVLGEKYCWLVANDTRRAGLIGCYQCFGFFVNKKFLYADLELNVALFAI
jgi:hypothetical protein